LGEGAWELETILKKAEREINKFCAKSEEKNWNSEDRRPGRKVVLGKEGSSERENRIRALLFPYKNRREGWGRRSWGGGNNLQRGRGKGGICRQKRGEGSRKAQKTRSIFSWGRTWKGTKEGSPKG